MLCCVSADFPLNRRMRKDIVRGKLHIVRMGDHTSMGSGTMPEEKKAANERNYTFFCQWVGRYDEIVRLSDEEKSDWLKDMINAIGREKIEKIMSAARDHFLQRFHEDAKSVVGELKEAGITIADYPRCYPDLAIKRKALTESVDQKLLWGKPGPANLLPYACIREHIQNIEKIFHLRGEEFIHQGGGFHYYQYYQSHEAECVKNACEQVSGWHEKQEAKMIQQNAKNMRQRDEVWFEESRGAFRGLERSEVLAARQCIRSAANLEKMLPGDDEKIIRILLTDNAFWENIKGEKSKIMEITAQSTAFDLDRFFADQTDYAPSRESILASIREAIKCADREKGQSVHDSVSFLIDYAMDTVLEWSKEGSFELIDGLEDNWRKISESRYFAPDAWIQNLRELEVHPIWIRGDSPQLSAHKHVLHRLEEIRRSYFFGNWLAVVALSRSLLESALIDKFGPEILNGENGNRRTLTEMVNMAANRIPDIEIQPDMGFIVADGNEVMHPRMSNIMPLERCKKNAQQCMRGIVRIISVLYPRGKF